MDRILRYYEYTTVAGDTFDQLALRFYNDEYKMSQIIAFNPDHWDTLIFEAGVKLKIPILETMPWSDSSPAWRKSEDSSTSSDVYDPKVIMSYENPLQQ
ncbi:MAG: tail protein X [Allobaculum sp.]|nr:tail protein X [Allobaculum sp.]